MTLTYDNRKEVSEYVHIVQESKSSGYFVTPFVSWELGSDESRNNLLRQYFPNMRARSSVTDEEIKMIQNRLHNRPRMRLLFKTSSEVFQQSLNRVAPRH